MSLHSTPDTFILGIDIGTTSVKVVVLNLKDNQVVAEQSKDTQSGVPSDQGIDGHKQDVPKIISALNQCVAKLPKDLLQQVVRIGICGQMHGVLFWHHRHFVKAWERIEKDNNLVRYDVRPNQVSHLYTWQDNRCTQDFLRRLPVPDSHLQIYSGYGIATIFWMMKYRPQEIAKYDYAGTIQDFTVTMLCDSVQPFMSEQNAASWGYFDCKAYRWNMEVLEKVPFPTYLLPPIKISGHIAGLLADTWHSIPKGTPIGVAMADLQCSVLATLESRADAVLNISTSAQIAYVVNDKVFTPETSGPPIMEPITYLPYFNRSYLAVAASLNGGNSLATFVRTLQQWVMELGFSVTQAKVWNKLIEMSCDDKAVSELDIKPTCLGERHNPNLSASISNINIGNLGLGKVFRAICEGVIKNLHSLMPKKVLEEAGIVRIIGNGSGLTRNQPLQEIVKEVYNLPFTLAKNADAAKGAAMAMYEYGDRNDKIE